ncbi:MAG: hypothetical protein JJ971_14995 [Balneolaceae bacterium]|nr:hypothetical protein [Balneolaceae bacterium]MBO6547705.1 hypothetical protein [Balneolaceae bacterium]MBO6648216.1 hypothetical protein [Balneolaceae bacterium]
MSIFNKAATHLIFIGLISIANYVFAEESTAHINCEQYELVNQLRAAFEEQISKVYKIEEQSDVYSKFLNYMSFDPKINSWMVQLSRETIVDSLISHTKFDSIWTNKNPQPEDILMEVVVVGEEVEEPEIWDVDTESDYFRCLMNTKVELLSELLVDTKNIGGFLSPRIISSLLTERLKEVDYNDRELRNFISINLYFTTLINLNLTEGWTNNE